MSEQKFKTGDVVKLKSGGPDMTVSGYLKPVDYAAAIYRTEPKDLGEGVIVQCTWFDGKKSMSHRYHEDLLDLVRAASE